MTPATLAAGLLAGTGADAEHWEVAAAVLSIADGLARGEPAVTCGAVRQACAMLNDARQFDQTRRLAQAWSACRSVDPTIEKHHAQALIELGALETAQACLDTAIQLASQPGATAQARSELPVYEGQMARIFKQRFVDTNDMDFLEAAYLRYLLQFSQRQNASDWHGINAVALLARAQRDGLTMAVNGAAGEWTVQDLAGIVRSRALAGAGRPEHAPWRYATLSEASLALGDYDAAELWLYRMLHHPSCTPFMLDSYERQLRDIWQAASTSGGEPGCAATLATIMSKHQMTGSARLAMSPARVHELRTAGKAELERNFSGAGSFTVDMVRRMLGACASVGCVCSRDGARLGTGFLVDAASMGAGAGPPVFMTNAHVLSDAVAGAVPMKDALVSFELAPSSDGKPVFFEVGALLFSSPPGPLGLCCDASEQLDATVVRLSRLPADMGALGVSAHLPLINGQTKAYVIGHPRGGGLQISVHDSVLLAADQAQRLLHYRTPTDPGSSGSPVFNEYWKVIALHHGGSARTPRLKPQSGEYEANEGVTMAAIRSGIGTSGAVTG